MCGTARVFELQLLPSLLRVLEVDKNADVNNYGSGEAPGLDAAYQKGGMDWGNIAIYTCPNRSCRSAEEYCVVQDSIDERPTGPKRRMPQSDAVIQEDTKFDLDVDGDEDEEDDGAVEAWEDDEDDDLGS